ncbi:MAG TPA: PEP-CTERM sorting domain-containing protein [Tepidisphaeraceae bacterium]
MHRALTPSRSVNAIMAIIAALAFTTVSVHAGTAGYLYVGDADQTSTTEANVNLPINAQTISNAKVDEHSLFEMSMSNTFGATGNIIEIGVTTDIGLNGDTNPHWFVFSWINGNGQGYDGSSHFVSDIGNFWANPLTSLEGTSEEVEFQYSAPNWDLDIDGTLAGYFPGSEWSGAFTASSVTQVFGEVYQDGTFYPTLNGTVSDYESSGGGHLARNLVDAPYSQSNASQTGFTASGPVPVPEPSSTCLLGITLLATAWPRRQRAERLIIKLAHQKSQSTAHRRQAVPAHVAAFLIAVL